MLLEEYKRSLKLPEAEEYLDLFIYRPIAFVFVKIIAPLPVTPNGITMLSLLAGLISAWQFSLQALIPAALWHAAANILDCSDGQLARLQNSGTPLGRVVDGVVDYISSIAIFLGIGFGLASCDSQLWLLVVAGGVSSALHAIVFDHYQNEFIANVRGEQNYLEREYQRLNETIVNLRKDSRGTFKMLFISLYLNYLSVQQRSTTNKQSIRHDNNVFRQKNMKMIRYWTFLGPTTNRSMLICCALAGRTDLFLWIVITLGNLWLLICSLLQRRIDRKLDSTPAFN